MTTDPYELIQELSVYDLVELRNKLGDTCGQHQIRETRALFDDPSLPELTYPAYRPSFGSERWGCWVAHRCRLYEGGERRA